MVADHLVIEMMNGGVDESKRQRLCPGPLTIARMKAVAKKGVAEPPPAAKAVVAMKAVAKPAIMPECEGRIDRYVSLRQIDEDATKLTKRLKKKKRQCRGGDSGYNGADKCANSAEYVPFTVNMREGRRTHLPDDHPIPTLCTTCAIAAAVRDKFRGGETANREALYVGMLPIKEAAKYTVACEPGAPAAMYRRDGFVVIDGNSAVKSAGDEVIFNVREYIRDQLHDLETLYNQKDGMDIERRHNGRRWKNIFQRNEEKSNKWRTDFETKTELLGVSLSQYFFPHEHYAQVAYNFASLLCSGGPEATDTTKGGRITKHAGETNEDAKEKWREGLVLEIMKGNLLAKSVDVDVPQDIHADGSHCMLNVIQPIVCGDEDYDFRVIRGSNDLLGVKEKINKLQVPGGEIETWRVKKDHIIVFAECVMHSGGRSSGWLRFRRGGEDVAEKVLPTVRKDGVESVFENYFGKCEGFLLSDLSIQLSFDYTPIRALVNPVLPEPHWALREGQFAEDGGGVFRAIREEKAKGAYKRRLDGGFMTWVKMIEKNDFSGPSHRITRSSYKCHS